MVDTVDQVVSDHKLAMTMARQEELLFELTQPPTTDEETSLEPRSSERTAPQSNTRYIGIPAREPGALDPLDTLGL